VRVPHPLLEPPYQERRHQRASGPGGAARWHLHKRIGVRRHARGDTPFVDAGRCDDLQARRLKPKQLATRAGTGGRAPRARTGGPRADVTDLDLPALPALVALLVAVFSLPYLRRDFNAQVAIANHRVVPGGKVIYRELLPLYLALFHVHLDNVHQQFVLLNGPQGLLRDHGLLRHRIGGILVQIVQIVQTVQIVQIVLVQALQGLCHEGGDGIVLLKVVDKICEGPLTSFWGARRHGARVESERVCRVLKK
jgi:hypothetical protein